MNRSISILKLALTNDLQSNIYEAHPIESAVDKKQNLPLHIGVACSGGKDSMVLTEILRQYCDEKGLKLTILTVDHGLHAQSQAHALSVIEYWQKFGLSALVLQADPELIQSGAGIEDGARTARYQVLDQARRQLKLSYIFLGHHAGDQAETLIMRLPKPSGLQGLCGIPNKRNWIIRPWLSCSPLHLEEAHQELGLPSFEDPTNHDPRYLRNALRQQLSLPMTKLFGSMWTERVARTAEHLNEEFEVLTYFWESFISQRLVDRRDIGRFSLVLSLESELMPEVILKKSLRYFYSQALYALSLKKDLRRVHDQLPLLMEVYRAQAGQQRSLPHGLKLWGSHHNLIISASTHFPVLPNEVMLDSNTLEQGGIVFWGEWELTLSQLPSSLLVKDRSPNQSEDETKIEKKGVCFLKVTPPIKLIRPPQGSRFQPFNSPGRKRVKRLWSDQKIPLFERDRLPVMIDGNGRILWVPYCRPHQDILSSQTSNSGKRFHIKWSLKT